MPNIHPKNALLSVSNKEGIVEFAAALHALSINIISTGGTSVLLQKANIPHQQVEDLTGMAEMLDGRVKTLHPKIHGGILARRDVHAAEMQAQNIPSIDLVVVNFYPFSATTSAEKLSVAEAIEYIDVGGPTMVRAAAKNFAWVGVVTDPADYAKVIAELKTNGELNLTIRQTLAKKVFDLTAQYEAAIANYFAGMESGMDPSFSIQSFETRSSVRVEEMHAVHRLETQGRSSGRTEEHLAECDMPQHLYLNLEKVNTLRYGENPHQKACAYKIIPQVSSHPSRRVPSVRPEERHYVPRLEGNARHLLSANGGLETRGTNGLDFIAGSTPGLLSAKQHQGKALSYNNLVDAEAAFACVQEFKAPAAVIVKHANPCGVAQAETIDLAYTRAHAADPVSAFGGILALNQLCTETIAQAVSQIFMEVIIAPAYTEAALKMLANKPNLRVLELPMHAQSKWEMKFIQGGVLMQEKDRHCLDATGLRVVTQAQPNKQSIADILFAWPVLKHIKSNAILIARDNATVGIGAGQVSRIDAVRLAIQKAGSLIQHSILASDAFFPFRDSIDHIAQSGIRAIVQPGGSMRDDEVIAACNEHGIVMVFTDTRCFKH